MKFPTSNFSLIDLPPISNYKTTDLQFLFRKLSDKVLCFIFIFLTKINVNFKFLNKNHALFSFTRRRIDNRDTLMTSIAGGPYCK